MIAKRIDSKKRNAGLTNWKGEIVTSKQAKIAKNYLEELELKRLELLAEQFLSYAELQIVEKRVMYMNDWLERLDKFLIFNEKEILHGAGSVSRKEMEDKVKGELKKFFDLKDNKELSSNKGDSHTLPSHKNTLKTR